MNYYFWLGADSEKAKREHEATVAKFEKLKALGWIVWA